MALAVVGGSAHPALVVAVASALDLTPAPCRSEQFPDGELRPGVEDVQGADVYVVQPTGSPTSHHLVELLLLLDACHRGGADRVTAVVPYFAYARQDRRTRAGESIGARVVLQALAGSGADALMVVDAHTPALEAMSGCPVEMLTAVPRLADVLSRSAPEVGVVVAPDLGASKLAQRYGALLGLPVAVIAKTRLSGATVRAEVLVGEVAGLVPVVVDDMISTAGTVEAAAAVLLAHGAVGPLVVAATHGLLVGPADRRLSALPLRQVLVTDSLPPVKALSLPLQVLPIAGLLADAITRRHRGQPLDDLLARL